MKSFWGWSGKRCHSHGHFAVYKLAQQLLGSFLWQSVLGVIWQALCQCGLYRHRQLQQPAPALSKRVLDKNILSFLKHGIQ